MGRGRGAEEVEAASDSRRELLALASDPSNVAAQDRAARTPPAKLVGRLLAVQGLGPAKVTGFFKVPPRMGGGRGDSMHSVEVIKLHAKNYIHLNRSLVGRRNSDARILT